MHRVELKEKHQNSDFFPSTPFLMHRVELKVAHIFYHIRLLVSFLMHRVELKGLNALQRYNAIAVPNAPCGVES